VIDGITGFLVAPEHPAMLVQRLRALLARPVMMQAYGISAADRARSRYCIGRIGEETAAAYKRCLPRTAPGEDELADTEEAEDLLGVAAFA
jgi:glycosyltransferase involved in cell wall biosynthesis